MKRLGEERDSLKNITVVSKKEALLDSLALVVLALWPLRHIHIGVDLQDTGYNYANYEYMGLSSMDPMWLFSTYLGNAFGHVLTLLPGGHTLLGMNLYTGLLVSALALCAYLFCTRRLQMPRGAAFAGEFLALCLCWCPAAKLYDYLTFVFLFLFAAFLYEGLAEGRRGLLALSGISLGLNVFVRFSNLPEALFLGLIWIYGILEFREQSADTQGNVRGRERTAALKQTALRTGLFLAGYLGAVGGMLVYLGIRYGFSAYFTGISQMLGVSGSASGYSAREMLYAMARTYLENLYWLNRMLCFVLAGVVLCAIAKLLDGRRIRRFGVRERRGIWPFRAGFSYLGLAYLASLLLAGGMLAFLLLRGFTSTYYRSYDPMVRGAILVLWLILLTAAVRTLAPDAGRRERLFSLLVAGTVLVTSVGSNNGLYPSFNNLFLAFPYLLWELYRLMRRKEPEAGGASPAPEEQAGRLARAAKVRPLSLVWQLRPWLSPFPLKSALAAFLALCAVQFSIFGAMFTFAESTGVQSSDYMVREVESLVGIRMEQGKSELLTELSSYVNQRDRSGDALTGREVILFADLPGLSFYFQMPSAFNPWSNLESYSVTRMAEELEALTRAREEAEEWEAQGEREADAERLGEIAEVSEGGPGEASAEESTEAEEGNGFRLPVVILNETYASRIEGGDGEAKNAQEEEKWELLRAYLAENGYELSYRGKRFAIYEASSSKNNEITDDSE